MKKHRKLTKEEVQSCDEQDEYVQTETKDGQYESEDAAWEAMDPHLESEASVSKRDGLFGVQRIEDIIETIIWSGWLSDRAPLSILLVAGPQSGKTQLMRQLRGNRGIEIMDVFTPTGMEAGGFSERIGKSDLKHIIITEFGRLFSNYTTKATNLMYLNTLIEEGSGLMVTKFVKSHKHYGACGILTAMTEKGFDKAERSLNELGFLTRTFVLFYRYSQDFLRKAEEGIAEGGEVRRSSHPPKHLELPKTSVKVPMPSDIYLQMLKVLRRRHLDQFRTIHRYASLTMALALKRGKKVVEMDDWLYVKRWYMPLLERPAPASLNPYLVFVPGRCYQCGKKVPKKLVEARLCKSCLGKKAKAKAKRDAAILRKAKKLLAKLPKKIQKIPKKKKKYKYDGRGYKWKE